MSNLPENIHAIINLYTALRKQVCLTNSVKLTQKRSYIRFWFIKHNYDNVRTILIRNEQSYKTQKAIEKVQLKH